ncbi:MAG TPA: hypothetical protein VJ890_13830 [Vineibacter sp.]|nr:hypothetical protein [Vineibacter sp.]
MRKIALLPLLALGVAACVPDGGYYDSPPRSSYYGGSPSGYYGGSPSGYYPRSSPGYYGSPSGYSPAYDDGGQCTFQTRRGPVIGYQPAGKNRCCIDTSRGPSCQ